MRSIAPGGGTRWKGRRPHGQPQRRTPPRPPEPVIGPATSGWTRWHGPPPPLRFTARGRIAEIVLATLLRVRALPNDHAPKIDSPPAKKGGEAPKGACQPLPRRTNKRCRLLIPKRGSAPRRQVYAVCALTCLRGALAFRRSAAALARANASAIGSAPVPAFPETRSSV